MNDKTELNELARQALAGRVACQLAHDINDLLMGVVGVASDGMNAATMRERRRALQTAVEYGRKIAELIKAFQEPFCHAASCHDAGPVNVAEALDRSLFLCQREIASQGIEVRQAYGLLPSVRADIGLLQRVFIELLHNALDAMSAGGVLELAADKAGEFVAATVSNTGRSPARHD